MTLLLYCICEGQAEVAPPASGVRGAAVRDIVEGGLRCFYSEIAELGGDADTVQKDAVDFHRVIHGILQTAAVIPFRFPTLVKDTGEIAAFAASHASEYGDALQRFRDAVQMEVRISLAGAAAAEAASGADYLRARADSSRKLDQAAASCSAAAQAYALEWRQRTSRDGVHCFALVRRSEVYNFEQALRGLQLDSTLKAIASGPWPATEFLKAEL
jgi:Gas vesicle synthesis protein GvpL/GvpF